MQLGSQLAIDTATCADTDREIETDTDTDTAADTDRADADLMLLSLANTKLQRGAESGHQATGSGLHTAAVTASICHFDLPHSGASACIIADSQIYNRNKNDQVKFEELLSNTIHV